MHLLRSSNDDIIATSHKGPVQVWMAPASGDNWTKIYSESYGNGQWAVDKLIAAHGQHSVLIPQVPSGDYLLRSEPSHLFGPNKFVEMS